MSLPALHKLFSFSRADSKAGKEDAESLKSTKKSSKPASIPPSHKRSQSSASTPNIPSCAAATATRWQLAPPRPREMEELYVAPALREEGRKSPRSSSSKEKRPQSKRSSSIANDGGKRKKSHHQSLSAVRFFEYLHISEESSRRRATLSGDLTLDSDSLQDSEGEAQKRASVDSSSTTMTDQSNGSSGSSSGSGSTLTQASYTRQEKDEVVKENGKLKKSPAHKPDALSFLDPDSSRDITRESIRQSIRSSTDQSPSSSNSSSPSSRSTASFENVDNDTDRSTSPERTPEKDKSKEKGKEKSGQVSPKTAGHIEAAKTARRKSYGTPEMPRGSAKLPHLSPSELTPRPPNQGQAHVKLPRAEKLPMTGYELLATRLTEQADRTTDQAVPYIRPMYRRFETLNHRLLLHLQDELCELEEQLHRLDTADTQNRRLQSCILPASRRAEYLSGGELQWHKTDTLGKIGFKLEQYNHVLSSFNTTQSLPTPTLEDINQYRTYLATHNPIAELETRFLDAIDDLVCVTDNLPATPDFEGSATATPMPRNFNLPSPANSNSSQYSGSYSQDVDDGDETRPFVPLSLAMATAVVVPVLTFGVIPGYLGRIAVVLLVGLGILGMLIQGRVVGVRATRDFLICASFYGGIMATIAALYQ